MHPILFKFGNITIYSYGACLAIGFAVAAFLATREAQRRGMDKNLVLDAAFTIIISGILGARALYVLLNLSYFVENPLEIVMLNRGGLVLYGGILAAVFALLIFVKIKKQHFLVFLDIFAPYAALGQAVGRIGCFFRGCCYGKPTTSALGMYFKEHHAILHPTQLISSLALVIIFIITRMMMNKAKFHGEVFFLYLMLYSSIRFFIEFLRGDSNPRLFNLTPFQIMSIPIFAVSLGLFLYVRRKPDLQI